jgi:hypothetical protein
MGIIYSPNSWYFYNHIDDLNNYEKYIRGLFYNLTLVTSVGFGALTPHHPIE